MSDEESGRSELVNAAKFFRFRVSTTQSLRDFFSSVEGYLILFLSEKLGVRLEKKASFTLALCIFVFYSSWEA